MAHRISLELVEAGTHGQAEEFVKSKLSGTRGDLVSSHTSPNGNPEFVVQVEDDGVATAVLDAVYGAGNHDGPDTYRLGA